MDEEKLIDLVRQHDLLYDPDSRYYTNKIKKEQVWEDIGRQLKRSGISCKNKWLNLRDQYRRTVRKQKMAENQGIKKKKWRYEDNMLFLQPFFREKTSNPDSFHIKYDSDEGEGERDQDSMMTFEEEGDESMLSSTNVFDYPASNETKKEEQTPIDAFFTAMAESVKTFPPLYQHIAKKRIFSVVSGIEIEILQGTDDASSNINHTPKQELFLSDS